MTAAENALARGDFAAAAALFQQRLMVRADDAVALRGLGQSLLGLGKPAQAAGPLLAAIEHAPQDGQAARLLSRLVNGAGNDGLALPGRPREKALLGLLGQRAVDQQDFFFLYAGFLLEGPLAPAAALLAGGNDDGAARWLLSGAGEAAAASPVLLGMLRQTINLDLTLERLLAATRRRILLDRLDRKPGRALPALLAALARQCHNNEFVWDEDDGEGAALDALQTALSDAIARRRRPGLEVLLYGLYRPLTRLPGLSKAPPPADGHARSLLDGLRAEARRERELAAVLPVIAAATDPVSQSVAAQYEDNPYPRWLSLTPPEPAKDVAAGLRVLVAGCGTGKQAITASLRYGPEARILAIDLSRAALAYGQRMSALYGCGNIRFAQADLLRLEGLEERFDVIECCGVLHHLADPMAGWRVLASLLAPGGTMTIALYSRRARHLVNLARQRVAAAGLKASDRTIRRFRAQTLRDGDPVGRLAGQSADYFSLSGVRDLLFHVQEHQFALPEIADCLERLGLEMTDIRLPPSRIRALLAEAGAPDRPLDPAVWDAIEARHPSLFQRMIFLRCRHKGGV